MLNQKLTSSIGRVSINLEKIKRTDLLGTSPELRLKMTSKLNLKLHKKMEKMTGMSQCSTLRIDSEL